MLDCKTDFYEFINEEWLNNTLLQSNQTHLDSFSETTNQVEQYIYTELQKYLCNAIDENSDLYNFIVFYRQALDFDKRESLGIQPLFSILNIYREMTSFSDYVSKLSELELLGLPNMFPLYVAPDIEDSCKNKVWASSPGLTFPDKRLYDLQDEYGSKVLDIWFQYQKELIMEVGISQDEACDILKKTITLDRWLLPYLQDSCEQVETHKVYELTDFQNLAPNIPISSFFREVARTVPKTIIVSENTFWEKAASIFYSNDMWDYVKAKLIYGVIVMYSHCLTDNISLMSSRFQNFMQGVEPDKNREKRAYELAQFALGNSLSSWYANNVLSDEDTHIIEDLVTKIIDHYRIQVEESKKISSSIREKIIEKLDNILVQVGGPTSVHFKQVKLFPEDNMVDSVNKLLSSESKYNWDKLYKDNNREDWEISSITVDAYYNAQMNKIVLPAGILQKPFFAKEYSLAKNLSRLGFLIAHEISHAFDMNGVLLDKHGNQVNWLSDKDNQYFQNLLKQVFAKYDGQFIDGYSINGWQTVSENIADIAGFSCVEKIVLDYSPDKIEEFYCEFTRLWRIKYRTEYLEMVVSSDTHLPNKLRVNNLLSNSTHFRKLYNILPNDGMDLKLRKQIEIW